MKKILSASALFAAVILLCSCNRQVIMIDYADFVRWNGVSYLNTETGIDPSLVGEEYGRVKRNPPSQVTGSKEPEALDGDAAFLPLDTPFYVINGLDRQAYIAVSLNGEYLLYKQLEAEMPRLPAAAETSAAPADTSAPATTKADASQATLPSKPAAAEAEASGLSKATTAAHVTASPQREMNTITLKIHEISKDYFTATLPWPYPATYKVFTSLCSTYCMGDTVEVTYTDDGMVQLEEFKYEITALSVAPSDFELEPNKVYKPVIYLYPEQKTEVSVKLDYNGTLTYTHPAYNDTWHVTALPDGTLYDENGKYPYLFWEGTGKTEYDMSRGFCIKGGDTEKFLNEKLAFMGMSETEIADFTKFWLPIMEKNKYNIIAFQGEAYLSSAKLTVSPQPESVLRVFMVFRPADAPEKLPAQQLERFERRGFTVVEWGGATTEKK